MKSLRPKKFSQKQAEYQQKLNEQQQNGKYIVQPSREAKQFVRKIFAANIKSVGVDCNANLRAIVLYFLTSIYQIRNNAQLLGLIKQQFLSQNINIAAIKNIPIDLQNIDHKDFFIDKLIFITTKVMQKHTIEDILIQNPIIMKVFILFIRSILTKYQIGGANDYTKALYTKDVYDVLIEVFDLTCKETLNLYMFIQQGLFISSHDGREFLFGLYYENQTEMRSTQQCLTKSTQEYLEKLRVIKKKAPLLDFLAESMISSGNSQQTPVFKKQSSYQNAPTPQFNKIDTVPHAFRRISEENIKLTQSKEVRNRYNINQKMVQSRNQFGICQIQTPQNISPIENCDDEENPEKSPFELFCNKFPVSPTTDSQYKKNVQSQIFSIDPSNCNFIKVQKRSNIHQIEQKSSNSSKPERKKLRFVEQENYSLEKVQRESHDKLKNSKRFNQLNESKRLRQFNLFSTFKGQDHKKSRVYNVNCQCIPNKKNRLQFISYVYDAQFDPLVEQNYQQYTIQTPPIEKAKYSMFSANNNSQFYNDSIFYEKSSKLKHQYSQKQESREQYSRKQFYNIFKKKPQKQSHNDVYPRYNNNVSLDQLSKKVCTQYKSPQQRYERGKQRHLQKMSKLKLNTLIDSNKRSKGHIQRLMHMIPLKDRKNSYNPNKNIFISQKLFNSNKGFLSPSNLHALMKY